MEAPAGEARPLREALVAWTAAVRGEIEPCGCPTVPYGGLARRARLLDRLRGLDVPVFTLDAGDMLVKGTVTRTADDRRQRAETLLALLPPLGLDAWAPGGSDRVPGGLDLLQGTGALGATWAGLPGATVLERGGVRLGVVGLGAPADPGVDPADAVRRAMDGLLADAWVVLSNADGPTNRRIATEIPAIAAVLTQRAEPDTPAPVLGVPDRGRYLGLLHLALGAPPGPLTLVDDGPVEKLAALRQRITHAERADWEGARAVGPLREEVAAVARGHNLAWVDRLPLGSDLDGASALDAQLGRFQVDATASAQARADTVPEGYVSGASCVRCHSDFFAAWLYSPHAKAFAPLLERGATKDPECLGCHTTGFGAPGGFGEPTESNLSRHKAVQCEACHGPRAGHPGAERRSAPVTEDTCLACHDEANSPQFEYGSYLARVSCLQVKRVGDPATLAPDPR